jgi:hypothetical protein
MEALTFIFNLLYLDQERGTVIKSERHRVLRVRGLSSKTLAAKVDIPLRNIRPHGVGHLFILMNIVDRACCHTLGWVYPEDHSCVKEKKMFL